MEHFVYLLLNTFTIAYPLARSFEPRIRFAQHWNALLPAVAVTGFFFIAWDAFFTYSGVWGFNEKYVIGLYIAGMPVEEWLFFLTVPYSCVFVYEVMNYFVKKDLLGPYAWHISLFLTVLFLAVGFFNLDKTYTSVAFLLSGLAVALAGLLWKPAFMGRFYVAYMVCLIPFFLVNGVLTYLPVVWYDDTENLGIRLISIPIEDAGYNMLLLLGVVSMYEKRKAGKNARA